VLLGSVASWTGAWHPTRGADPDPDADPDPGAAPDPDADLDPEAGPDPEPDAALHAARRASPAKPAKTSDRNTPTILAGGTRERRSGPYRVTGRLPFAVPRSLIERRLADSVKRLKRAREELAVIDEQASALNETAEEARLRALVSETPLANKEYQEAQRHADAMERAKRAVLSSIAELQRAQDDLLDRLVIESH
jgi:hypothetical protein